MTLKVGFYKCDYSTRRKFVQNEIRPNMRIEALENTASNKAKSHSANNYWQ
jgi:hypothetical protein